MRVAAGTCAAKITRLMDVRSLGSGGTRCWNSQCASEWIVSSKPSFSAWVSGRFRGLHAGEIGFVEFVAPRRRGLSCGRLLVRCEPGTDADSIPTRCPTREDDG